MWAGPLAATPDEMPVIGGLTEYSGLLVAGGTYAFTFAPLWGLILSQLATGQIPDIDLTGLSPDRLVESL